MTELFERIDFHRLASAFGVTVEQVHDAVGKVGTLYRQRANRDKTKDELALEVERLQALVKESTDQLLSICDGSNWPEYAQNGVGYQAYTEITEQLHDIIANQQSRTDHGKAPNDR